MTSVDTPHHLLRRMLPGELRGDGRRSARDRLADLGCVVLAVLVGLIVFDLEVAWRPPLPDLLALADFATAAVLCLAVFWRRRFPVGLAVLTALAGTFSPLSAGAGIVMLLTVGARCRPRAVLAVAGLQALATLPYLAIYPDREFGYAFSLVWTWTILAMFTGWALLIGARRQLVQSLRERAERAEAEQEHRVAQARQRERARIAREMHDVLAHRISLLSLHAGALEFRPDAPPQEVARAAGVIRDSAHQALEDLRQVIGVLRLADPGDEPDRPQPTLADLPALVEESRSAGMRVQLSQRLPEPGAVPAHAGRTAYRVVQEGLTNARKHAPGAAVQVAVGGGPDDGITVEVLSRAALGGAPGIPGTGTGLVGLAERVALAGGRIEHGRTGTGDFRLWTWQPWPA